MIDEKDYLEIVRQVVKQLTPAKRRMLALFVAHEIEALTRRQLARLIGKSYLMRYDIKVLDDLVKTGLVIKRKQRLEDWYGKPRDYNGRNISLASRFYTYQINPDITPYLRQLTRTPKAGQKATKQAKPIAIRYSSPLAWLREKLGI